MLKHDALTMALNFVQQNTLNWTVYQKIHQKLLQMPGNTAHNGPDLTSDVAKSSNSLLPSYDQTWIEQTMKKAIMKTEKLDTDLKHYKSNSIKESTRRGQDDLGEHYLDMGDLMNALKCFTRARDYCTTNKHILSMCFNVIKVSAYSNNWSLLLNYVNRAESTPELSQPQAGKEASASRFQSITKLKCAAGLAELSNQKYKAAAKCFLQAQFDHLNYPELISPNNVAVYGSLCALASFDRQDLQKLVITNAGFKQFLELEPQLNNIITKFYESKYAACLRLLDEIKDNLRIDIYLAPHIANLYDLIRNRGLIQYFSPYLSADLHRMADSFNTSVLALEDELSKLILDGQVKARIDSHNKVLHAKGVDQRALTYNHALNTGKDAQKRGATLLLRAAIHRAGVVVKMPLRDNSLNIVNEMAVTPDNSGPSSPA